MNSYLQKHIASSYLTTVKTSPGLSRYENKNGWFDYYVGPNIIFSHRKTYYSYSHFPDRILSHTFYEMDIYIDGKVSYILGNQEITPNRDDIILIPPNCEHTARLLDNSEYDRYVFYFSPSIFTGLGNDCIPLSFQSKNPSYRYVNNESRGQFVFLLEQLKNIVNSNDHDAGLMAFSTIINFFYLIEHNTTISNNNLSSIPQKILDIKAYIDKNSQIINSATEVAKKLFYSREHISKIFKQYYNITLTDYIMIQKINCAKKVLSQGKSVSYAASLAGFNSMSSFVNAFKIQTGMTPSQYRRSIN